MSRDWCGKLKVKLDAYDVFKQISVYECRIGSDTIFGPCSEVNPKFNPKHTSSEL